MNKFIEVLTNKKKAVGLNNGGLPNLLDACRITKSSWDNICQDTIIKCWVKSKILFITHDNELTTNTEYRTKDKLTKKEVENISEKLDRLMISEDTSFFPRKTKDSNHKFKT